MKINRIAWQNYRGLNDGEIIADGHNVTVQGRNGSGKSSIASVVPFVLFGKDVGKAKTYEDGLIPADDGGIVHAAEVSFGDGTTFRREYFWNGSGNKQSLFINDKPVKMLEFKVAVMNLTMNLDCFALNPFAFCELSKDKQRDFLIKSFGIPDTSKLFELPQYKDLPRLLGKYSAERYIADTRVAIKESRKDMDKFESAITELNQNIVSQKVDADADKLDEEINQLKLERNNIGKETPTEIAQIDAQINSLVAEKMDAADKMPFSYGAAYNAKVMQDLQFRRAAILAKRDNRSAELEDVEKQLFTIQEDKICPTCGQPLLSHSKLKESLKAKRGDLNNALIEIDATLDDINQAIKDRDADKPADSPVKKKIAEIDEQIAKLNDEKAKLNADFKATCDSLRDDVNQRIEGKISLLAQIKAVDKLKQRLQHVLGQRSQAAADIAQFEHRIQIANLFLQDEIQIIENGISEHFKHVRFKLFDYRITTGELVTTCEATLNGVPYSSLSKGERLKAALDIFDSLQIKYGVNLPVILDDFESFTKNSILPISNQQFLFKVVDADLSVNVEDDNNADLPDLSTRVLQH